jgi:hypothetical protein
MLVGFLVLLGFGCGGGGEADKTPDEAAAPADSASEAVEEPASPEPAEPEKPKLGATLQPIVYGLESENSQTRIQALVKVAELGPKAEPILDRVLALADDPDPDVRTTLARTLVKLEGPESLEHLAGMMEDESALVKEEVLLQITPMESERVTEILLDALQDEDGVIRAAAIHAIGERGESDALVVARLEDALEDYEGPVIRAAAQALGQLLATGSASKVARCLLDRDDGVRQIACKTLEQLNIANDDIVYGLIGCLDDDSMGVREAAFHALLQVTGAEDTYGYDPREMDSETREEAIERWRNFWESKKDS